MYRFKKILVTGGAGCIGIQICNQLVKKGYKVVLFDLYEQINTVKTYLDSRIELFFGSILDISCIREAIRGCDGVIHLAAYLGVRRTELNKIRCLEINIDGTRNVLNSCSVNKIKKIIFASSSEVYGEPLENPVTEKEITKGKTVYAISKLAGEELVKAYYDEFKIDYTILRYFNTYGPHQISQFVIPKFIYMVSNNRPPVIYGDGSQERSYNFSKDSASATIKALVSKKTNSKVLNIGNSKELINLRDLANLVIKVCSKNKKLKPIIRSDFKKTDRKKEREINRRFCSTELAKKLIGYKPKTKLEIGIRQVFKTGVLKNKWATSERDYFIDDYLNEKF
jgi:UDP-glucose 4-epimerase